MITNILTVLICFLFLNQLAKITFVKGTYLIPFLLFLVYLGGFATKNSFGDMLLIVIFGAIGWLMVKFDWQRPPLLLGLVLGGIAENNLFIAEPHLRIYLALASGCFSHWVHYRRRHCVSLFAGLVQAFERDKQRSIRIGRKTAVRTEAPAAGHANRPKSIRAIYLGHFCLRRLPGEIWLRRV